MKKLQAQSRKGTFREGRGEFVGDLRPGLDMLPCNILLPARSHSITNGSKIIGSTPSMGLPVHYLAFLGYPHFHASAYIPLSIQLLPQLFRRFVCSQPAILVKFRGPHDDPLPLDPGLPDPWWHLLAIATVGGKAWE